MFVVDTDVISRTSPLSREGHRVGEWLRRHGDVSYICASTIAEMDFGESRLRLRGATRQAAVLASWIELVIGSFERKILPLDLDVGRRTGEMLARAEKAGFDPGFVDACIAATADVHGFEVVTFNARDFAAFGVPHRRPDPGTARS